MKKVWLTRLSKELPLHPLIDKIKFDDGCIRVYYCTGARRTYIIGPTPKKRIYSRGLDEEESIIDPINIGQQYPSAPNPDKYPYVSRKQIKELSYLQKELLVQRLIKLIQDEFPLLPYVDSHILESDYENIKNDSKIYRKGMFSIHHSSRDPEFIFKSGYQILLNHIDGFMDISHPSGKNRTLTKAFTDLKILMYIIPSLVYKTKHNISISTIWHETIKSRYGPVVRNPALYKGIMEQIIEPNIKIYDATPGTGSKFVACSILRHKYYANRDFNKLSKFLNWPINKQNHYDLILLDNNFRQLPIDKIKKYKDTGDKSLIYVEQEDYKKYNKEFNVIRPIRLEKMSKYGFLLLIDNS